MVNARHVRAVMRPHVVVQRDQSVGDLGKGIREQLGVAQAFLHVGDEGVMVCMYVCSLYVCMYACMYE